jgi:hypothetical protein
MTSPARKAPSPRESPHRWATKAVPVTTIITVRARISRLFNRMTSFRSRGTRNRVRTRSAATPTPAFASVRSTSADFAVSHCRSEGRRSIIAMTARSWKIRIPTAIFP